MSEATNDVRRTLGEAFDALRRDKRVAHGAYRLWHTLYHNRNTKTGKCCPGVREIRKQQGGTFNSICAWQKNLVESGWLKVAHVPSGKSHGGVRSIFTLLDGYGCPLFESAT